MYKAVFQNSKIALLFAIMTIMSAVSMVGTSEDSGVLVKAADLASEARQNMTRDARAFSQSRSRGDDPDAAASDKKAAVFGEFASETEDDSETDSDSTGYKGNPADAPLSPHAVRATTPHSDVPYISERQLTVEPQ